MGISIGLTGLGAFGSAFADLFRSHPLVDRVGLCDQEPERIAQFADQEAWQGKFDQSEKHIRKALAIDPKYPEAMAKLGNFAAAEARFRQALQIAPNFRAAQDNLRRVLSRKKGAGP